MRARGTPVVLLAFVLSLVAGCGGGPVREAAERAHALASSGQAEAALAAYRAGRERWPEEAVFPYGEGVTLYQMDRPDAAEAPLREAVRLDPDDGWHHLYLGHVLYAQERYDEAIAAYTEMTRLEPLEARGWKALGWARYHAGQPGNARLAFEKYLAFARHAEDFETIRRLVLTLPGTPEGD